MDTGNEADAGRETDHHQPHGSGQDCGQLADTTQQLRDGRGNAGTDGRAEHPDGGCMAHPIDAGMQRRPGVGAGNARGGQDGEAPLPGRGREDRQADDGQVEFGLGELPHGTSAGVGLPECAPLSDSELAEIFEWMEKSDNRTDELRLLGNGVVPAVAEKAWRVLFEELEQSTRET